MRLPRSLRSLAMTEKGMSLAMTNGAFGLGNMSTSVIWSDDWQFANHIGIIQINMPVLIADAVKSNVFDLEDDECRVCRMKKIKKEFKS